MKKSIQILTLLFALSAGSYADEVFTTYAYTGTQTVGSVIDVQVGNSMQDFSFWIYWVGGSPAYTYTGYGPQGWGAPGDSGASLVSPIATGWSLPFANWGTGYGWALLTIDTNYAPGTYYVGNVNCTGGAIWVILN
ncbi:MAG: hypothetical protein JWM32_2562 [Verrucomicrobia bacterium]|nr:hypothetical protein [Verrucomicrobiota bacterium]